MITIRITVTSLVFLLFFVSSFALSGRYLDNMFYYETLDRLLEHEDDVDTTLIIDLQRALREIDRHETQNSNDDANICDIITKG